jgi:FAD/FMN-containing dehydrogenase
MAYEGSGFDKFASGLRGPLLMPGDSGYEEARRLWNGQIDKRPAAILRASGVADVMDGVRFAREQDLPLSIKGNGHNIAGLALADGALTIDLSSLKGIRIDPAARIAHVQPGCNWGDVDRDGQAFGRTVPGGIVSTTGVAGLTLGGGFGWATRRFGLTSDNLLSADVVTAEGAFLKASQQENTDLFWALCGGGGNFGVVTSFEFALRPVGPQVTAGLVLHPLEDGRGVLELFREVTAAADDDLTCLLVLRKAPPATFLPEAIHGAPVAGIAVCHIGSLEAGARAVQPLKSFGRPVADLIGPKPFSAHQMMFDAGNPYGRRYYWKSDYLDALSDEMIDTILDHAADLTSPHSVILLMHLGGAAARLPADHSAAGNRSAEYVFNIAASWEAPPDEAHVDWARAFWRDMHPHARGVYVNFLTEDEVAERTNAAYGDPLYRRLAELKAKYDPENVFRINHNIKPAAA